MLHGGPSMAFVHILLLNYDVRLGPSIACILFSATSNCPTEIEMQLGHVSCIAIPYPWLPSW